MKVMRWERPGYWITALLCSGLLTATLYAGGVP